MADKKQNNNHRSEPRQWSGTFVVVFLMVLASGVLSSVRWVDGPVQRIAVSGDFKYLNKNQLEEIISENLSDSFLSLSLDDLKQSLEVMPWVYEATVRRTWPYTLKIKVEEESPISRWNDTAFVNQGGEVIFIEENNDLASLPVLEGEDKFSADILALYRDVASFSATKNLLVSRLSQDSVGSITVTYTDGSMVLLGRHEKLVRLQRFLRIYSQEQVSGLVFDARYSNGVAVAKNTQIEQPAQQLALQ